MRKVIFIVFGLLIGASSFGQKDSLKFRAMLNLQAIYQTGNLNQHGGNAIVNIGMSNSKWDYLLNGSYNYVTVEDFNIINDTWSYLAVKRGYTKRFYPIGMMYYGYAKSHGIVQSLAMSAGAGWYVFNDGSMKYLNANVMGGYIYFDYQQRNMNSAPVINTMVQSSLPITNNKLVLYWEFHHFSGVTMNNYGFQNQVRIGIPLTKHFMISMSNSLVYNKQVDFGRRNLNTMSMFGIQIQ